MFEPAISALLWAAVSVVVPKLLKAPSGWSLRVPGWLSFIRLAYVRTAGATVFGLAASAAIDLSLSNHPHHLVTYVIAYGVALVGLSVAIATTVVIDRGATGQKSAVRPGPLDGRYEALRDLLGKSVTVGLELSGEDGNLILRDAWEAHTRLLIESAYGNGEVVHVFTPDLSQPRAYVGLEMSNAPRPLAEPIERIRKLLGRMSSLTIRSGFKPQGWHPFDPTGYRVGHALEIRKLDGEFHCPWCGMGIDNSSDCDSCGAERGGDFLYRKTSDGPSAFDRLLGRTPRDASALLADLFKEGDDLRSQCLKAPEGNLAQKAHWYIVGGTPREQCAREDQAREWDQRVAEFLWSKSNLKRFGPGWKPAGAPIKKATDHPNQSMMNPSRLAEWYQGKLDYLRNVIERLEEIAVSGTRPA